MKNPALQLEDIQGNVLQGYGFPEAAYVTLKVKKQRHGRGLLAELRPQVTPATLWERRPASTLNIAISHEGSGGSASASTCSPASRPSSARAWPRAPGTWATRAAARPAAGRRACGRRTSTCW